jgi:hypothetical protein
MNKVQQERKVERAIHKALSDLQVLTGIYIGEREIERGDTTPAEEVWKKFKKKYAFKLPDKNKENIKREIKRIMILHDEVGLCNYVFQLLERRDEIFKQKHPKMYPSPYPNHL